MILLAIIIILIIIASVALYRLLVPGSLDSFIYFDNNGTVAPYLLTELTMLKNSRLGNPSGHYAVKAKAALNNAQASMMNLLKLDDAWTVIFNSGASEGNNHVLRGFADYIKQPNYIVSSIEHHTSTACARYLESMQKITLTLAKPSSEGVYDPVAFAQLIQPTTALISIMHTNNEIGSVNPIHDICATVKKIRPDIYIHVDCVQSFGKEILPLASWQCDAITVSFHKIGGPQGLGALVIKKDFLNKLTPLIFGTQFNNARGGTENTNAISAVPITLDITFKNRTSKTERLLKFKNYIVNALAEAFQIGDYSNYYGKPDSFVPSTSELVFLGPTNNGLPDNLRSSPTTISMSYIKNNLNNHFCNIKLRKYLLSKKIVVSTGSACATEATYLNHVLESIMAPFIIRCGIIRISLGDSNDEREVLYLVKKLISGIKKQK